jgi:hypothetical protein
MTDTLKFAEAAESKHLLIAHHDPSHTDSLLGRMFSSLRRSQQYEFLYEMAVEGMEFELP